MTQQECVNKLIETFGTRELALKCIKELLRLVDSYYIVSGYKDMRYQKEFLDGVKDKLVNN